jgi:hypothetical protein
MTKNTDFEIESDALREAEFMQVRSLLDGLVGRTIVEARVEDTRIALVTDDKRTFYFFGFMGDDQPDDQPEA